MKEKQKVFYTESSALDFVINEMTKEKELVVIFSIGNYHVERGEGILRTWETEVMRYDHNHINITTEMISEEYRNKLVKAWESMMGL